MPPHTSYNQVHLHELRGCAKCAMSECQRDIVTSAASEHVTNVSIGAPYAIGGAALTAKRHTGASEARTYRERRCGKKTTIELS